MMADNVDHNPANLVGRNTVHWMGMTLAISPVCPGNPRIIPRLEVPKDQVVSLTSSMVHTFNTEEIKTLGGLTYRELKVEMNNDNHNHLDLLWKCKQLILPNSPLWAGLMQAAFGESETLCTTSVIYLPMIFHQLTLPVSYSTLQYIPFRVQMYHKRPVCTFDQALWWKALQVLTSPRCNIQSFIIRLGEFHTRMNFLGCIGHIMANTGLSEAFELVYVGITLPHLFSGKTIDRAWQAHQLVDISLNTLLLKDSMENNEINVDILQNMIKDALNGSLDISAIKSNPLLQVVKGELEQKKEMVKENRTATLWLQYLDHA